MKKQKKRVYVYVDDDELEQFKALALQKVGINNLSLLVRQLLREELFEQSAQGLPEQSNNVSGSPDDENQGETKTGQFIRLSPQEKAWFVQLAKQKEMSVNALICTILRAYRENNPKLFNDEIATLQHSNYQISAIGRNLNQIAKRLNAANGVSLTTTQINQLRAEIQEHCQQVGKVLKESRTRHSYHI